MGQAKHRKEQFRKTPQTCVLCGARVATTMDRVPPRALFPPPRPNLITLPACETCNRSASEAEEKFKVSLSAKSGVDTPNSLDFWKSGGLRTVRNNKKLLRELMSGTPLFIRSLSTGQFERTRTFKWPRSAHDPVIEKITRGLYYHHFDNPLPASAEIEVTFLSGLPDPVREFAMGQDLVRCNLGGDDRFCYAYARVEQSPEFSIWIYQFYLRHWAGAITKPEGHDFDQNEPP
jgi:hypothetical protein